MGHVAIIHCYEDEVRSYRTADGRTFVVLHDVFATLGLNPDRHIASMKDNPLYEGFLSCQDLPVPQPKGGWRTVRMEALDLDMAPMALAPSELSQVGAANRDKLLRDQRESAKALRGQA
jgi:hypothetical protein